jgi:hypothetical protein
MKVMKIVVLIGSVKKTDLEGYRTMSSALAESNLNRALELIGGSIDPEIAESYPSLEARILAQALENVEVAERRLRQIQQLVGEISEVLV